jgi:hypothetical protein
MESIYSLHNSLLHKVQLHVFLQFLYPFSCAVKVFVLLSWEEVLVLSFMAHKMSVKMCVGTKYIEYIYLENYSVFPLVGIGTPPPPPPVPPLPQATVSPPRGVGGEIRTTGEKA